MEKEIVEEGILLEVDTNEEGSKSMQQGIELEAQGSGGYYEYPYSENETKALMENMAAFDTVLVSTTSIRHKIYPDSTVKLFVSATTEEGEEVMLLAKLLSTSMKELRGEQSGYCKRADDESGDHPDIVCYKVASGGVEFTPINGSVITGIRV